MRIDRREFLRYMSGGMALALLGKIRPGFAASPDDAPVMTSHPVVKYSEKELKKLRICFYDSVDPSGKFDPRRFFPPILIGLYNGMVLHGYNVSWGRFNDPVDCDLAVIGGWAQHRVIRSHQKAGKNILVVEQGNIQRRTKWPSLGFNGLVGYATYAPTPDDKGTRFHDNFGHHLMPWKKNEKGYALLIGQMPEDLSLHGLDMEAWLQEMTDKLSKHYKVMYRPHPILVDIARIFNDPLFVPKGATLARGSLAENLSGAAFTVIYSSTTAVESILSGTSTVTMSRGCAGWGASSHSLESPFHYPDRTQWCNDWAWRQWKMKELVNGDAWEHTRQAILL